MTIFTTLYIMRFSPNPMNSIYKIGITRNIEKRRNDISNTLPNNILKVVWTGKFLLAYFVEQFLHAMLSPINVYMPEHVSGYTEFFDLNWFTVWILKCLLNFYIFARFIFLVVGLWAALNWEYVIAYIHDITG